MCIEVKTIYIWDQFYLEKRVQCKPSFSTSLPKCTAVPKLPKRSGTTDLYSINTCNNVL